MLFHIYHPMVFVAFFVNRYNDNKRLIFYTLRKGGKYEKSIPSNVDGYGSRDTSSSNRTGRMPDM